MPFLLLINKENVFFLAQNNNAVFKKRIIKGFSRKFPFFHGSLGPKKVK